jgi:ABC-2 type transport system permease protein
VKGLLSTYPTLLRVAIAENVQYRASGMVWMLGMFIEPLIYLAVWAAVSHSEGVIGGYDERGFAAYYLAFFAVNHFTFSWVMEVFQYRIQMGSLSFELLRPIHPIHADIAENIGFKLVMLVVMLPGTALIYVLFSPRFETQPWALALSPLAIALGFLSRFCIEWVVALAAFWTTRITAVNRTYSWVYAFLAGRIAPLAVLPDWLANTARVSPFYSFVGFPVELAIGKLDPAQAVQGLLTQAIWVVIALAVLKLAWSRALRTYAAVGS